jgi:hypothetical protein
MSAEATSKAVYWSLMDPGQLTCQSPAEALEEWLDSRYCPTTEADVAAKCPLFVTGYSRKKVEGAETYAEEAVERLRESLSEEYGDPDGDNDILSGEVEKKLTEEIAAAIEKALASAVSWQCEPTERHRFDAEEVIAALRELRSHRVSRGGTD